MTFWTNCLTLRGKKAEKSDLEANLSELGLLHIIS